MQSLVDEVWIKGRFDGDYSAIPGMGQKSEADTETTRVHFTRGRLTEIERVSGPPPAGKAYLRQEVLDKAHMTAPDGQAWITPLQDLHIVDWESDSTAGILGGGGPRVGRLVGWVYARVSDPRQTSRKQAGQSRRPMASANASDATQAQPASGDSESPGSNDSGDTSTPQPNNASGISSPPSTSQPLDSGKTTPDPSPADDVANPPLAAHPCRVCSWGRALFLFIIVWVVCSIGWAFLAITPLLIRCFLARGSFAALSADGKERYLESGVMFVLGVGAFGYLVWRALLGCSDIPIAATVALGILFLLVPWSARTRLCWLIGLLGWLWGLAILMTCPAHDGTCRTMPDIRGTVSQALSSGQNKLDQVFRPDRDAQDVSGQSSTSDGWTRVSVDEAEKRPEKFFNCTGKSDRRRDHYVIYMGESALFDLNQAALSDDSEPQLLRIGKLLQKYPQSNLIVVGHADKSPHRDGPEGNLALSERRAAAVVDWLMAGGYVKPEHIVAMGAGDRYPLFDTPGEFRGNRRVEVRVVCPGAKP